VNIVPTFPELLDQLPNDPNVRRVYGEPYVTPDGVTVIPVAKIREGRGFVGSPIGVFVVRGDDAQWVPAVDGNRVALIGVVTGLLAAVIGSLAVLRQPPWPRITITDYR
jgi:hypothetical protein